MSYSRRHFLRQVSTAAALGIVYPVVGRELWAKTPDELLPTPNEALLQELALIAVDAAREAGATFADVRVTAGRLFNLQAHMMGGRPSVGRPLSWPQLDVQTAYGVRAIVDGAWGFAGGSVLTPEAVATVAQEAVGRARANRPRRSRTLELAPVPQVENGRWATPIELDPFSVPLRDQADLAIAALSAAEGVKGVLEAQIRLHWNQQLRVFASSEGSQIVQRVCLASPIASTSGRSRDDHEPESESLRLPRGGYGYEALGVDLVTAMREATERAVARSRPLDPTGVVPVEVGRYDVVFGPEAVQWLVRPTLGEALNLERALGYHTNREGTTFARPPAQFLGRYEIGSSLVTLTADRTRRHGWATVGWDDEGVAASEYPLIENGVIVDYVTTRQTAVELEDWYRQRGGPVRPGGCASGLGQAWPDLASPNLTLEPGAEDVSLEDMIADTRRGYFVEYVHAGLFDGGGGGADQQVLSAQFSGDGVREIRNGRLGRGTPTGQFAFQFLTPQFWKKLDALGGPASAVVGEHAAVIGQQGFQLRNPMRQRSLGPNALAAEAISISAVPARVRDINVLNAARVL